MRLPKDATTPGFTVFAHLDDDYAYKIATAWEPVTFPYPVVEVTPECENVWLT